MRRLRSRCSRLASIDTPFEALEEAPRRRQALVQGQILFLGLERAVRRVERDIAQERLRVTRVLTDESCRGIGDQIRRVAGIVAGIESRVPVDFSFPFVGEVVDGTVVVPVELGEAATKRMILLVGVSQVPLSEDPAMLVADLGEDVCHGPLRQVHAPISPGGIDRAHRAVPNRIASGHQASPGRRADRSDVVPVQFDALDGDPVDIRGGDVSSVEAHIGPSKIVGQQDDNVRTGVRRFAVGSWRRRATRKGGNKRNRKESPHGRYGSRWQCAVSGTSEPPVRMW